MHHIEKHIRKNNLKVGLWAWLSWTGAGRTGEWCGCGGRPPRKAVQAC